MIRIAFVIMGAVVGVAIMGAFRINGRFLQALIHCQVFPPQLQNGGSMDKHEMQQKIK